MTIRYQHTQRGTVMIAMLLVAAVVLASLASLEPSPARWISLALAGGMGILAGLFSSLTVVVDDDGLRWFFGPGAWSYRLAPAEIESVRIVRNNWLNGLGIRMRPGFRLYNVSGLDAVEVELKSGEIRRIGTDDPSGLAAALTR
jgi:hypothetical protein